MNGNSVGFLCVQVRKLPGFMPSLINMKPCKFLVCISALSHLKQSGAQSVFVGFQKAAAEALPALWFWNWRGFMRWLSAPRAEGHRVPAWHSLCVGNFSAEDWKVLNSSQNHRGKLIIFKVLLL